MGSRFHEPDQQGSESRIQCPIWFPAHGCLRPCDFFRRIEQALDVRFWLPALSLFYSTSKIMSSLELNVPLLFI